MPVERGGLDGDASAGPRTDGLHDGVTVAIAIGEGEEDMKRDRFQHLDMSISDMSILHD